MPKAISDALRAHLAQSVTTLATCWSIIRLDGVGYAFTTLDADIIVSGTTFRSTSGFSRSAITATTTGGVDNLEVQGYYSDDGISEQDLRNGLFDYADVYLFMVNWEDPTMGVLRMRRGFLGEVTTSTTGAYQAELRGMTQALVQEFHEVFQPICRADLGDHQCKVPIRPPPWTSTYYPAGSYAQAVTTTNDTELAAVFQSQTGGGGSSGGAEPAWDFGIGATTVDGGVLWTSIRPFRLIGHVIGAGDTRGFTTTPLRYTANELGTQGSLHFIGGVTANTSIEISDGSRTYSFTITYDDTGGDFYGKIKTDIEGGRFTPQMTATYDAENNIYLTNHSGLQAYISKTGDGGNNIRIGQFADNYMDGGTLTWITGANTGVSMEVKTYDPGGQAVYLWLRMKYPINVGDRFWYYPGCDLLATTCDQKFSNILNFRGEPDMPGTNRMLSYPDAVGS